VIVSRTGDSGVRVVATPPLPALGLRSWLHWIQNPAGRIRNLFQDNTLRHDTGGAAAPGTTVRAKTAHAAAIAVLAGVAAQELVEVVLAWPRLKAPIEAVGGRGGDSTSLPSVMLST